MFKISKKNAEIAKATPSTGILAETGIHRAYDKINAARAIYYHRLLTTDNKTLAKALQHQQGSGLPCSWIHQVYKLLKESNVERRENALTMT